MNKKRGFSLTELMVTLVIVSILAITGVPIYRSYVKRGITSEGNSLLAEINAAQQIYYVRHGSYFSGNAQDLGVVMGRLKYFTSCTITGNSNSFTVVAQSSKGHTLSLVGSASQTGVAGEDNITDTTNYDN